MAQLPVTTVSHWPVDERPRALSKLRMQYDA